MVASDIKARPLEQTQEEAPKKDPSLTPSLKQLKLRLASGQLTMVAGAVGCGKSSLLSALLGEMHATKGSSVTRTPGSLSFVAQTPFIVNETVRENICFGLPLDEQLYQRVVHACALLPDLKILPGGDMTQIGEKGVNLSGGQKARISLARACYAQASVVLLDDPLSAVDAHVGKHLFRHVLGRRGILAGATRVLVTHQTQFLPLADQIIVMEAGCVAHTGTYPQLREAGVDLTALKGEQHNSLENDEEVDWADIVGEIQQSPAPTPPQPARRGVPGAAAGAPAGAPSLAPVAEGGKGAAKNGAGGAETSVQEGDRKRDNAGSQLTQQEERAEGRVSRHVVLSYGRFMGGPVGLWAVLFLVFLLCTDRAAIVFTDAWLAMWIDADDVNDLAKYLPVYIGVALAATGLVYVRSWITMVAMGVRAAKTLYERVTSSVLAAPMAFFEATPTGRILNRFTSDTETVDNLMLQNLQQWLNCIMPVIGTSVLICVVNPYYVAWLLPLIVTFVLLRNYAAGAQRDLQRLESVTRSPIFAQFSETLNGLPTIRAFGASARFAARNAELVDANTRCFYSQYLANQWVSIRLDIIGALVILGAALLPVVMTHTGNRVKIGLVGLAISQALEVCAFLKHATRMTLELEKSFAGVERLIEYAETLPREPRDGAPLPMAEWPTAGGIVATGLGVRYRPELPYALRDVSCAIAPRSKVGIVGRTGSGKSTFVSALWRLVELEGSLQIDGVDVRALGLKELRSRLAIIPQDPVLFNATVRYNLDPFHVQPEAELRRVLELVQMKDVIDGLPSGLAHGVKEGGANFSVGQRQLLCLARATLRHSKVLVLDEATASIDNGTDAVLQAAIRKTFDACTVLTIAHRLHTIMDSTEVMLFDAGRLAEHAPPHTLLADPASLFSKLVDDTGSAADHLRTLAREAHEARGGA